MGVELPYLRKAPGAVDKYNKEKGSKKANHDKKKPVMAYFSYTQPNGYEEEKGKEARAYVFLYGFRAYVNIERDQNCRHEVSPQTFFPIYFSHKSFI